MNLKRGSVHWVNLDLPLGSEIKKMRPCVLVGASPINEARHTVVIVPLSTAAKPRPPIAIPVSCLGKDVVAVCDQIRSVDKSRFVKEAGELSKEDMKKLDEGLKVVLAL